MHLETALIKLSNIAHVMMTFRNTLGLHLSTAILIGIFIKEAFNWRPNADLSTMDPQGVLKYSGAQLIFIIVICESLFITLCNILLLHSISYVGSVSINFFPFCGLCKLNKALDVNLAINDFSSSFPLKLSSLSDLLALPYK